MKLFILEDSQSRITLFNSWYVDHELTMTDDAMEAIEILKRDKFDVIFLDHDLDQRTFVDSSEPNTGYTVAKEIPNTVNVNTQVILHSMNPDGVNNMAAVLKANNPQKIPFGSKLAKILKA